MKTTFVFVILCILVTIFVQQGSADDLKIVKQNTCEPGSTFMRDCNTCKCSAQGTVAHCTRRSCTTPTATDKNT